MSYILDALRRADAERERGAVPGLHAQTLTVDTPAGRGPHRPERWWVAAGGVMLAAALATAGWVLSREPVPAAATPVAVPSVVPQGVPPLVPSTVPAAAPAAPPAIAAPRAERTPAAAAPPAPARSPVADADDVDETPPARSAARRPATERTTPRAAVAARPDTQPEAVRRIFALDELPPEVRGQLPTLSVSGSIYSDDAASRFVMINGEAVREGGRITPELTLERIQLKSAVLRFKGYRYRIPL